MILDAKGNPIQPADPTFDEVAAAPDDDLAYGFIGDLRQVQDRILKRQADGLDAYEKLLTDDQVQSTFQQRRRTVVAREWEVVPGAEDRASEMAADWLRETLDHIDWDRVVDKMLYTIFFGHGHGELMYVREGQRIMVDSIRVRDRSRFRWDRDFRLRMVTTSNYQGEVLPRRKLWSFQTGTTHDDDPYGMGLGHFLYWPVYFKRNGLKLWLSKLDKAVKGNIFGRYPSGSKKSEQKKLLKALQILRDGGAIIFPEGMDIDSLAKGVGEARTVDNKELHETMDRAISKVVNSQTMTTDAQAGGLGSTQADVHQGVALNVQKSDADLLCGSFNAGTPFSEGPVEWLTQWNFGDAATPPRVRYVFPELEEREDLSDAAERDQALFQAGWQRTQESMDETYGEGYVPKAETEPMPPPPPDPTFAEGDGLRTVDELTSRAGATMLDDMVEPIRQLLQEADSLEDARDRIYDLYSEMDADQLGTVLMRAMVTADLAGRYEVQEGE